MIVFDYFTLFFSIIILNNPRTAKANPFSKTRISHAKGDRSLPKSLPYQGLNLVFAQSRNATVCGESSCLHQNQLDWAQKAIYLA